MTMRLARRSLPSSLLVAVVVALAAGCTESKTVPARRLLTTITKANKRLETASQNFAKVVSRRLADKASDADLRAGVSSYRNAIERIREDSEKWGIPRTAEARALADDFRASLDRRMETIDELGPKIIETMANELLPTKQKAPKAGELFEAIAERIEGEVSALRRAQREYAGSAGVFAYE